MRWKRRVEDLLYDGETVVDSVETGTARVVVTSHRVLAFTPEMDGENFTQADLPNVESVEASSQTEGGLLRRAIQAGVVGVALLATGLVVDFGSLFGDTSFDADAAQEVGAGGLISLVQRMLAFMSQLDYLLRVFGALALFLAAVSFGVYWFLRDQTLRIAVAGDGTDIHLPRPDEATETRVRLEGAIFPDETPAVADAGPEFDDTTGVTEDTAESGFEFGDGVGDDGRNDDAFGDT